MQSDPEKNSGHVEHKVHHCRQRFSWDCGVTCVLMLLSQEERDHALDNFAQLCDEEGFGQSTWTIDLAYLLKRFNIKHCMYTTKLGVNEDNRRHGYYNKIMDLDRARVQRRFSSAECDGIRVVERAVPLPDVLQHVTRRGPAILLIDAGLLSCRLCKHNKLRVEFRRCFGGGYRGHYIVLVGVTSTLVLYRDPAHARRLCAATATDIDRARRAPGTDLDLLLVDTDLRPG